MINMRNYSSYELQNNHHNKKILDPEMLILKNRRYANIIVYLLMLIFKYRWKTFCNHIIREVSSRFV